MNIINSALRILASICGCIIILGCSANADPSSSRQNAQKTATVIIQLIEQIKSDDSSTIRTQHAQELSQTIHSMNPSTIDAEDVDALADMMFDKDDSVRYWMAMSLGYIGPHAQRAVPALEKALEERACDHSSKTSASAIKFALNKIGAISTTGDCRLKR